MDQVYLIKYEFLSNPSHSTFFEIVFKDYSEARKFAKNIVAKTCKKYLNLYQEDALLFELSPDLWSNKKEAISIVVFKIKDLTFIKSFEKRKKGNTIKKPAMIYLECLQ